MLVLNGLLDILTSFKEFKELKNIDGRYYCSYFYDVSLNCYGDEVGTCLRH